ncbi:hypothetical protein GCM10010319_68560 [Streptomyces blastmyceticus]|uniref:Uncharacterized protein n=1 Tax=Streptomyces blastmyceticus TaxID=68180 RepID=A0ABN0Y1X0_9ACTN
MQWGRHGQAAAGRTRCGSVLRVLRSMCGRDRPGHRAAAAALRERLGAVRGNGAEAGGYDQPMVCPGAAVAAEAAMVATAAAVARRRQSMGEALF